MLFIEWEFKLRMKQILHNLEDLTSHFSNLGLKEAGGTEIKSESEYRPMPPIMTIQPAISHFSKAPSRFLKFKGSTSMKPPKAPSKARLFKFGKGSPSMNPPKAPSPKAVSGRVLGREKEKDQVVDFLQYLSCNENTVTSILGLVGPGGIGKTTLARLVYEDDKVRKSFQLRVWVTFPSYQLEAKTLAKIILIKLKVSFNQDDQLADLLTLLRKNSSGKKLLLVLDGCWSVREWEEVRNCFESAARGSAIILTTRTTKAALQMLVDDILHVSFLSDEHCFSLFSDHCIRSSYYTLDRKKIVSKCGGVPLAAKMLGGLLCEKLREESTTSLGEMWESKEWKYSDIYLAKPFVRLCYRYLSVPLRRCIAYLATFHKGCQFQKSHVVRDWIDDGLIESRDDESMERLGNKYFDSLVARSFLIRSNSGGEAVFTMHDMVRDFALAVYENSQFRFEENDESNLIKNIQNAEESSSELYEPQMEEYTPLNPNITHGLDHQSPEIDVKLPTTTTDDVVQPSFESETDFDTLRIWDSSNLKELPPKLHSLRIEDCRTFKSLQDVLMGRSTNLYELFIIRCPFLQYFTHKPCPTSLKTLYVHECRKLEFLRSLEKMQNFKFLESLFIGSSCNTLKTFPMTHFPKLKILCIWDCPNLESLSIEGRKKNVLALESLEIRDCSNLVSFPATGILFPYLRSFLVSNCKKIKSLPTPMSSLTSLQSVFVIKCPELESLPEGGLPSCLKQLSIAFCDKLIPRHNWKLQGLQCLQRFEIESGCMGLKSFPEKSLLRVNLNSLYISKLTSLEIWDHHALQQLTALQSLEINCCENLKSLPEFLPSSLTFLAIKESPLLSRKLLDQSSTHWHKIAHISNIQIDNNVISKNGELSDSFVSRYSIPVTANTKRTSYDQSKDSKFSINKMEEGALEPKRMPHGAPVGESF